MNKKYLFVFLAIILLLILAACSTEKPKIELETISFEFGDVINGVIISRDLRIDNVGNAPLEINDIATSCGCTSAVIDPKLILPGESATLHIEFDSGAHGPDATGELMRQVFIFSNDPKQPEAMVEFTVNVVK